MAFVGQVIDDKYEILKLVGQGGMSKVYLAMDKRLNKQWAVKEIEKRAKDRNNEIVIQGLKNHPVEYNDLVVRQLIECIKVMSKDTLHIYFKDGIKLETQM